MNSAQCVHCAAPLPAAAEACPYCNFVTPLGEERARQRAAEGARVAQWHEQQQVAARYAAGQRAALEAEARGRLALWVGLGSFFTCMAPAGLVAIFLGLGARSRARAAGIKTPAGALVALIAGPISLVSWVVLGVLFSQAVKKHDARLAELHEKLAATHAAARLEQRTACDLVEEYVLESGFGGKGGLNLTSTACIGPFVGTDAAATLRGVHLEFGTVDTHDVTACLVRGSRWFVVHVGEVTTCLDVAIPTAGTKLTEKEIVVQESLARRDYQKTLDALTDAGSSRHRGNSRDAGSARDAGSSSDARSDH